MHRTHAENGKKIKIYKILFIELYIINHTSHNYVFFLNNKLNFHLHSTSHHHYKIG